MTPIRAKYLGSLLLMTLLANPAFALEWDNPSRQIRLAPLQEETEVVFAFANRSGRAVTIRRVESNCDCLAASADRSLVGIGECGRIVARFSVGDRVGTYERSIRVQTDESSEPTTLLVQFDVPPASSVSPRATEWSINSPPKPLMVEVTAGEGLQIDFTEAVATSDQFATSIEPIQPGRTYRVTVTPASTRESTSAAIRIRGREAGGREIVVSAYAYVR